MNKERLLNVAKALRQSKNPESFDMCTVHGCGTPACAFGHYAARRDMQQVFQLPTRDYESQREGFITRNTVLQGAWGATKATACWGQTLSEHFGITASQVDELFSSDGCGNAKTALRAAQYIERMVANET